MWFAFLLGIQKGMAGMTQSTSLVIKDLAFALMKS